MRSLACLLALAVSLLLAAPTAAQTSRSEERRLQQGDELVVTIPSRGAAEESVVQIDELGEIALGLYGRVPLAGLTPREARSVLRAHLSEFIRNTAGISLTLVHPQTLVFVTGMVEAPGLVTIAEMQDAWSAIQAAGGVSDGADLSHVVILRDGREIALDMRAYLTRQGTGSLPAVEPGDTIFVSAQPGLPNTTGAASAFLSEASLVGRVFVLGAVNAPGLYDLAPGMNALAALAAAGGPTADASLDQARLVTPTSSRVVNIAQLIRGDAGADTVLPPDGGVILYLPHEGALSHNPVAEGISVIGGLNGAGFVETAEPLPLHETVALAGGPTIEANLHRVEHVHQGERFTLASDYNLRRYFRRGGTAGRVDVHPGDVVYLNQRERPWETFIGVVSDLAIVTSAVVVFATLGAR